MKDTVIYSSQNPMPGEKFSQLFDIMESSFPREEHGSAELHRSEFAIPEFRCLCYEPDGIPSAFMNYYQFTDENTVFLEHFAVAHELRGNKTGTHLMEYLRTLTSPMMTVLEVEPPEGEIQRRRIGFYQRLGFIMNDGEYFQPDFYGTSEVIPLKLMSTEPMNEARFAEITQLIHKRVYRK